MPINDDMLCDRCWRYGKDSQCSCQRRVPARSVAVKVLQSDARGHLRLPSAKTVWQDENDDARLDVAAIIARSDNYVRMMRSHAPTCQWRKGTGGCTCGIVRR